MSDTDMAAAFAAAAKAASGRAPAKGASRKRSQILPSKSPYRDLPTLIGIDGRPRCRWCPSHEIIPPAGLCGACWDTYVFHKMHSCVCCGEPSARPLRKGLCQPCIGAGEDVIENLDALVKARWIGRMR